MPAARASEPRVKPRSDAYVGLLGLSLLALSAAALFAFLNYDTIKEKPPAVKMAAPAGGGAPRTQPPAPGPVNNPPQQGGNQQPPAPNVNQPGNPPGNPPANPQGGNAQPKDQKDQPKKQ